MPKSLSIDLRSRVIAAISDGASCREAARRFGVSAASAIRWRSLAKTKGDARPKPQGGDQRSSRTEAHSAAILKLYQDKPDITLAEIRASLSENGVHVGHASLWRFFVRHDITLKKSRRTPASKSEPTS